MTKSTLTINSDAPVPADDQKCLNRTSSTGSLCSVASRHVVENLASDARLSDQTCQDLQNLLSDLNEDLTKKEALVSYLCQETQLAKHQVSKALESLHVRYQNNPAGNVSTQLSPTVKKQDIETVEQALVSPKGREFVRKNFGVQRDDQSDRAPGASNLRDDLVRDESVYLDAEEIEELEEAAIDEPLTSTADLDRQVITLDTDSSLNQFESLKGVLKGREEKARAVKASIQEKHTQVLADLDVIQNTLSQLNTSKALLPDRLTDLILREGMFVLKAGGVKGEFRTLVGKETKKLPKVDDLSDIEKNIDDLKKPLQKNLENLKNQIEKFKHDGTNDAELNDLISQRNALDSKLTTITKMKESVGSIKRDHEYAMGFNRWAGDKDSSLPIAVNVLGLREEVGKDGSFVELMKNSGNGSGNHSLDRAVYIRTGMVGLMDQFQPGKYSRGDVQVLGSNLGKMDEQTTQNLMKAFEEPSDRVRSPSFNVASVAVMNLVAAGFNPKTMQRDAPRLQYKIEEKGFSMRKRMSYIGQPGVTVRNPVKHILPRLQALEGIQKTFKSVLYPSNKPVNIDPALTSKDSLLEFGSMMIASMPQDFLVVHEDLVGKLQGLCVECSKDGSQFPDLKKKFLEVHQEVSQRFEKFDSEQASELTRVADDSVIAVHRRGAFKKVAAEVARAFMVTLGRPTASFTKTVLQLWDNASAMEGFRKAMRNASTTMVMVHLIRDIENAVKTKAITDQQGSLIKQFLLGSIDKIDMSSFPKDGLNERSLQAIKKHAQDVWKKVNKNTPVPLDLVLFPDGTEPSPVRSTHFVAAQSNNNPLVSTPAVSDSKQAGHVSQPQQTDRTIKGVSGNKNRCWLRAANASAVNFKGTEDISQRVFAALTAAKENWTDDRQNNLKDSEVLSPNYIPYWPKDVEQVKSIYDSLLDSETSGYEINQENEDKLQKITLQLTIPILVKPDTTTLVGTKRDGEDSLADNIRALSAMKPVQGDRQIITGFLKEIGLSATVVSGSTENKYLQEVLADKDKIVIRHRGTVNSGHFDFYSKVA